MNQNKIFFGDVSAHPGKQSGFGRVWSAKTMMLTLTTTEDKTPILQLCRNNALSIMNTFFQRSDVHKNTWCRGSGDQQSLSNFCIVSGDLFSSALDIPVRRDAEVSTQQHLVICNLHLEKPLGPTQMCKARRFYRIKRKDQTDRDVWKTFVDSASYFWELPEALCTRRQNGDCSKPFSVVSAAARVCGQKRHGVAINGKKSNPLMEPKGIDVVQVKKSSWVGNLRPTRTVNVVRIRIFVTEFRSRHRFKTKLHDNMQTV